ncbi:MAG: hypothetical protein M3137_08570 [Actinomycetota bacterium]|nr:hypothetical protein [Actinomycetota bacterium]
MQDVLGDATAADLAAAWRLAFAVCGEQAVADAATEAAVASQVSWLGPPSPIELLSATYREVEPLLSSATPDGGSDPLLTGWWALPMDQRAALWLRVAERRSSTLAAEILCLAPGAVTSLVDTAQDQLVPAGATDDCPSRQELAAWVNSTLPAAEGVAMREHVPACDTCEQRFSLVERLQALGDPLTGPVPVATDAGREALDSYLLAPREAWEGDLIDDGPTPPPAPVAPPPPVAPPKPMAPPKPVAPPSPITPPALRGRVPLSPSSAEDPAGRRRPPRRAGGGAEKKRAPSLPPAPEMPLGTVAAAALAAFRSALGEEDATSSVDDGRVADRASDVVPGPDPRFHPDGSLDHEASSDPDDFFGPGRGGPAAAPLDAKTSDDKDRLAKATPVNTTPVHVPPVHVPPIRVTPRRVTPLRVTPLSVTPGDAPPVNATADDDRDGTEDPPPDVAPEPSPTEDGGRFGRFLRGRRSLPSASSSVADLSNLDFSEAISPVSAPEPIDASPLGSTADEPPSPDGGHRAEAVDRAAKTKGSAGQGSEEVAWPIDEWASDDSASDDSAWAAFTVDDTPPAFAALVEDGTAGGPEAKTPETADKSERPASSASPGVALDPAEPVTTIADPGGGTAGVGYQPQDELRHPFPRAGRPVRLLKPKVLAVATAGVLAAGIVGVIVVHPRHLPHFETVNLGAKGPPLFPGATADPNRATPPSSNPLIVIPPAAPVATTLPGTLPPLPAASAPSTTVASGKTPATVGRAPSAAVGQPSRRTTPPTATPPRSSSPSTTPTTTKPAPNPPTPPPPPSPPKPQCVSILGIPIPGCG